MNSIAIIENPATRSADQLRYIVVLVSNVLRKNSAWDHASIGAAIDSVVKNRTAASIEEEASAETIRAAGKSN